MSSDPQKQKAHSAVQRAIKNGILESIKGEALAEGMNTGIGINWDIL